MFDYSDHEGMLRFIQQHNAGSNGHGMSEAAQSFSRRNLTKELAQLLLKIEQE
jgi:hypothetical protein